MFNTYIVVQDVFLKFIRSKTCTFAFIRYQLERKCDRVVEIGNGRKLDGRVIGVKKAVCGGVE